MAIDIKPAKASPRVDKEVLKWYVGDTFSIEWLIQLYKDETHLILDENDEIVFNFFTRDEKQLIHTFSFTNIQEETVCLDFTEEVSNKFPVGRYIYCAKFIDHDGTTVTIFAKKLVEVEPCH